MAGAALEKMRLKIRQQQIELNKDTISLRIAELEEEIRRLKENFPSYDAEINDIIEQVTALEESISK